MKSTKYRWMTEVLLILLMVAAVGVLLVHVADKDDHKTMKAARELENGWYYLEEGQRIDVELPADIRYDSQEGLVLYNDSLDRTDEGMTVSISAARYRVTVSMHGTVLYEYDDSGFLRNDQMASKLWCDFTLPVMEEPSELMLELENTENGMYHIGRAYIGNSREIFFRYLLKDSVNIAIIMLMLFLGMLSLGIAVCLYAAKIRDQRFVDIAVFEILCAVWCLTDSALGQAFTGNSSMLCYVSFYAFMLLAVPMVHFIRDAGIMKRHRILDVCIYLFLINAIVQSILNYLGIFTFTQMLFVTHILLVGSVAAATWILMRGYHEKKDRHLFCILVAFGCLAAGGVGALLLYWLFTIPYYQTIFETGIVVFSVIILGDVIASMVANVKFRAEMAVCERLAKEDRLTGMKNRRAYEEHIDEIEDHIDAYHNVALVYMDLNGLKSVNDQYGHNVGDDMIIAAAKCITNVFEDCCTGGACYRVGGDEFCAILPDCEVSEKEFSQCLDEEIRRYNRQGKRYRLSIARGVSYLKDADGKCKRISDWKYEADRAMYRNKKKQKADMAYERV